MDAAEVHWRPLGTLLVERGLLSAAELEDALEAQRETGKRLGEILVERGLVSHPALSDTLARQYGIELASESGFGTGLRALIERRHAASRQGVLPQASGDGDVEAQRDAVELEDVVRAPDQLIALEPQLEEQWARLAAAEAKVAERDASIDELEQELAERAAAASTQGRALNRRLRTLRKELARCERKTASLETEIETARAARARATDVRDREREQAQRLRGEIDTARTALEERQDELRSLQAEVAAERARAESFQSEVEQLNAGASQRAGEELAQRLGDEARSLRGERDSLAAELAEAQAALAAAAEGAGRESIAESAVEEQRRNVETLAALLDEVRRDRDAARKNHSEAERAAAALERERDEQARELAMALSTAAAHEARVRDLEDELQRRLGELGSAHDERGKLAQLVKRLGEEQTARQRLLAEATERADRQRRRADELTEEAARQVEEEREERARLTPRLEALQREVAASEQRLASAAVRVLGERRKQDEERSRAEAAEAASRRYKYRLSELEQSTARPA